MKKILTMSGAAGLLLVAGVALAAGQQFVSTKNNSYGPGDSVVTGVSLAPFTIPEISGTAVQFQYTVKNTTTQKRQYYADSEFVAQNPVSGTQTYPISATEPSILLAPGQSITISQAGFIPKMICVGSGVPAIAKVTIVEYTATGSPVMGNANQAPSFVIKNSGGTVCPVR